MDTAALFLNFADNLMSIENQYSEHIDNRKRLVLEKGSSNRCQELILLHRNLTTYQVKLIKARAIRG